MAAADLPAPPVRHRRALPAVAVVAVIAAVVLGGYVVAGALSEPAGPDVVVADVVSVPPLSGWEVAARSDRPPGVRLTRGSATLDVAAITVGGSATDVLRAYVSRFLEPDADRLSISDVEIVTLASGASGARISYVGSFGYVQTPIEGEVTAVVSPSGVGIVFDGWAPTGMLRFVSDDLHAMIDGAEVA
jgi:hypothetical protein